MNYEVKYSLLSFSWFFCVYLILHACDFFTCYDKYVCDFSFIYKRKKEIERKCMFSVISMYMCLSIFFSDFWFYF